MKRRFSNMFITFLFFVIVTIIVMLILPSINKCSFIHMDCFYTYSFLETLEESIIYSSLLALIFYSILRLFRKDGKK